MHCNLHELISRGHLTPAVSMPAASSTTVGCVPFGARRLMLSSQRGARVRAILRAQALDRVRSVVCKSAKCTTRTFFVVQGQGDLEVEVCSRRPVLYVAAVSLILRISDLGGLQCPTLARVPAAVHTPEQ